MSPEMTGFDFIPAAAAAGTLRGLSHRSSASAGTLSLFTCSAEMNSACAEIFASQKYSYGAPRRPICDGAPGGRTGAKENPRRMAGIFQESKNYSSMSITTRSPTVRPIPQKLRFCGNPVHFTCSAEVNSACAEIFASQKYSYGAPRRPICDGAPGGRTGAKENPRRMAGIFQESKNYSSMSITTPEPTVRPPSRIAKRRPFSMAMGVISSTFMSTLSPGMHISVPSGRVMTPVTSVVRK